MAEVDGAAAPAEQNESDLQQEVEKLREENKQLKERVEQQDKEIADLKERVKQQDEGGDGMRKRKTSFGKGRFARKPRKKQSEAEEGAPKEGEAAATTEPDAQPAEGEQADGSSPEKKATPSKKKATIRDRLGRAFHRFRSPKGYEAPHDSEATSPTSPGGVIVPERKSLSWTVARSFLRAPQSTTDDTVLPADVADYVPFNEWTKDAIREWLIDLELQRYANNCQWTGEDMLKVTDEQIEKELGVKNPVHRKKLRLTLNAIASGVDLSPEILKMDVRAVAEWLEYNGVPASIVETFVDCSVDGRVLTFLSLDDLSYMKVSTTFMQATIKRGIQLLRKNDYYRAYMKPFEEPEPLPDMVEPEPSSPAPVAQSTEETAAEEKPKEEGKPAEGEEPKPAEGGEEATAAEPPKQEKTPEEVKQEEKKKAEAAKERQRRRYEQLSNALSSQKPVVTWSNSEVMVWLRGAQLEEYANQLKDTGVTGALMVLDPCFTPESLCNALGISSRAREQYDLIQEKLPALLGEEVMAEKDEASKLEGYTALTPTAKPKKKRSLSFSGALRRKAKGEKTTTVPTSGNYLCSLEVHMTEQFIEAHAKDCSVPPPQAEPENKQEGRAEASGEKADLDDEADHETVPLVEKTEEVEEKPKTLAATAAETSPAEAPPATEGADAKPAEEPESKPTEEATPEEKKEEKETEEPAAGLLEDQEKTEG